MSNHPGLLKDALVDSGVRVSLISKFVVNKVGIPISRSSLARVVAKIGGMVHCIGIVKDVGIECLRIRGEACNKYHINLKQSISIFPNFRQFGVIQKFETLLRESFNYWEDVWYAIVSSVLPCRILLSSSIQPLLWSAVVKHEKGVDVGLDVRVILVFRILIRHGVVVDQFCRR